MHLHLGHWRGLPPLAILFLAILWLERGSCIATEAYYYWLAIIVIRTAATNIADLATHDFGLSYAASDLGLSTLLIGVLLADQVHKHFTPPVRVALEPIIKLPATDMPYWVAMLVAGTLGTASGDWVAHSVGLSFGSIVLVGIFGVVLVAAWRFGRMSMSWYWASIVAALTAGTTLGDYLAGRHGLHLGLSVSARLNSLHARRRGRALAPRRGAARATAG